MNTCDDHEFPLLTTGINKPTKTKPDGYNFNSLSDIIHPLVISANTI